MKPKVQRMIAQSARGGRTYRLSPLNIMNQGEEELGFDIKPDEKSKVAEYLKKEIDSSIADHTINIHTNVKY